RLADVRAGIVIVQFIDEDIVGARKAAGEHAEIVAGAVAIPGESDAAVGELGHSSATVLAGVLVSGYGLVDGERRARRQSGGGEFTRVNAGAVGVVRPVGGQEATIGQ